MRVGVVGSRGYLPLGHVRRYVAALPEGSVVVTGGSTGPDAAAQQEAQLRGLEVALHLPRNGGAQAQHARNSRVVADCDVLVAFWDGSSHGTASTVDKALRARKPVLVYQQGARPTLTLHAPHWQGWWALPDPLAVYWPPKEEQP